MLRQIFQILCACALLWGAVSHADDGILGNVEEQADDLFVQFMASRTELPRDFVVLGHGRSVSLREKRSDIFENEYLFLDARQGSADGSSRLAAFAIERISEDFTRQPLWEQTLTVKGKRGVICVMRLI